MVEPLQDSSSRSCANNRNTQFKKYVNASLPTLDASAVPNREINQNLDAVELKESVKDWKSRKSTFLNEISNELIKCSLDTLCKPILYLFNTILELGDFPSCWNEGLIIPIHKKSDRPCVDDYRSIIISSCMGKLFIKIFTRWIDTYLRTKDIWKKTMWFQVGPMTICLY